LLLYGIAFSAGGIPLIYLGDELGMENDPELDKDPAHAKDSRWVHRLVWQEALFRERHDPATVTGQVFEGIKKMIEQRSKHPVFAVQSIEVLESGHPSVLMFRKKSESETLVVVGNFSEYEATVPREVCARAFEGRLAVDLLASGAINVRFSGCGAPGENSKQGALTLKPCELKWMLAEH
jgi:amylosucrase